MLATLYRPNQSRLTALLVIDGEGERTLCPFFGRCDGLLIVDPDTDAREFHPNTERTVEAMCELILKTGLSRLVLGFIPGAAAQKLREAGVDIRLGSCARAVRDLASRFDNLPVL